MWTLQIKNELDVPVGDMPGSERTATCSAKSEVSVQRRNRFAGFLELCSTMMEMATKMGCVDFI
jgi:hypothetical protein